MPPEHPVPPVPRVPPATRAAALALLLATTGCARGLLPETPPLHPADAIVVLGNRPPVDAEGNVRPELRRRLEKGLALFRAGHAPLLVFTGGPDGRGHVEAEEMRRFALARGVPAERIRIEPRSRDTIENAGFTVALLCGADPTCVPELIVVSAPFHLRRARRLFECAGARVQLAAAELPAEDPDAYARRFAFYERFARLYYGFIDPCRRSAEARRRGAAPP